MSTFNNKVLWRGALKPDPAIADINGLSDLWRDTITTGAFSTGYNKISGAVIPSGKIVILHSISAYTTQYSTGRQYLYLLSSAVNYQLNSNPGGVVKTGISYIGRLVVNEGERIEAGWDGCTINDQGILQCTGYIITKY